MSALGEGELSQVTGPAAAPVAQPKQAAAVPLLTSSPGLFGPQKASVLHATGGPWCSG